VPLLGQAEPVEHRVGRALVKNPTLCFADEPTSALDWSRGMLVVRLLHDAARRHGRTVLVVSHDSRVAEYADRVLSIADGKLPDRVPSGTPGYAARFLETSDRRGPSEGRDRT
jgi:ABC-type lipoprotein export system ATPase subunit